MTHRFEPADTGELARLAEQVRYAYSTLTDPAPGDEVVSTDTSGPVQAVIVSDAVYEAWRSIYAAPAPETPPARVDNTADEDEEPKPKRRRAPKKPKTSDTRGA